MTVNDVVNNVEVFGLKRSLKESKYPMAVNINDCDDTITQRQLKLAEAPKGSGHDNFLCGIVVRFDLIFTVKAWTEAERYHWLEIVSSQSTMHRITQMLSFKEDCFIQYVTSNTKTEMERLLEIYNDDPTEYNYLRLLYNCPAGLKLTAGMVTNYQQLKTIYSQRHNHKLPEWRLFCEMIEGLPLANELIIGNKKGD